VFETGVPLILGHDIYIHIYSLINKLIMPTNQLAALTHLQPIINNINMYANIHSKEINQSAALFQSHSIISKEN